jgi:hypothetical protein
MLTTRETLDQVQVHLEESMGVRDRVVQSSHLSPMPRAKDVGRRPHASFGTVAIDRVIPDPSQPRTVLSDEALDRLARSIRKKGQLTQSASGGRKNKKNGPSLPASGVGRQPSGPGCRRSTVIFTTAI